MQDPTPELILRLSQPGDAAAFRRLNEQWIEKLFKLEAPDRAVLEHPDRHIIALGGTIVIAESSGQVIGTCALLFQHPGIYEVAKMAVDELWRGCGIGRKLLLFTIAEARRMGAHTLRLETSSKLPNAIHLYESVGFHHVPAHESPYARADVFMEMKL